MQIYKGVLCIRVKLHEQVFAMGVRAFMELQGKTFSCTIKSSSD